MSEQRPHGRYVSKKLFEAVFGAWRRDSGTIKHSHVKVPPLAVAEQSGTWIGKTKPKARGEGGEW